HIYYLHRRSFLLQYDTGCHGAADRAGLAPGRTVWFRRLLWNVRGRPASKIRSSKIYEADARYSHHLRCGSLRLATLAVKILPFPIHQILPSRILTLEPSHEIV